MKKLIYLLVFLLLILTINKKCKENKKYKKCFGNTKFETLEDIHIWIWNNIEYESDNIVLKNYDFWQPPELTLERGKGDCEDQAMLFQWMAKKYLNKDVALIEILIQYDPDKFINYTHIMCVANGLVYEPTSGMIYPKEYLQLYMILYIYLPDEIDQVRYYRNGGF